MEQKNNYARGGPVAVAAHSLRGGARRKGKADPKERSLSQHGALHSAAGRVRDEIFEHSKFFDARDLVQVKYEMLRRVAKDGWAISAAARTYGFSRPSFYAAKAAFERDGLLGLLPKRRGPHGPHKLTAEVVRFGHERRGADPGLKWEALAKLVRSELGVKVHPKSLERALRRAGGARHD